MTFWERVVAGTFLMLLTLGMFAGAYLTLHVIGGLSEPVSVGAAVVFALYSPADDLERGWR